MARAVAPSDRGKGGWGWGMGDTGWAAMALLAVLLPVTASARWFNAAYTATLDDVESGVWLLKLSVLGLAIAAFLVRRITVDSPAVDPAPARGERWSWMLLAILLL